ncbi:NAC domain-containing protein 71-like isoform X2 [Carex rostrata]
MDTLRALNLPPGFGFHPTDVELISHYLKRKVHDQKIDYDVIPEIDIYKYEPWDLSSKCIVPTSDTKWHFFTPRDRKYPNGSRSNRATKAGYWKSTGKDRNIRRNNKVIGTKKTLVFHEGRPPAGRRTEWIMHEYYLDENECKNAPDLKDLFVLCRVTKRDGISSDADTSAPREVFNELQQVGTTPVALKPELKYYSPGEGSEDENPFLLQEDIQSILGTLNHENTQDLQFLKDDTIPIPTSSAYHCDFANYSNGDDETGIVLRQRSTISSYDSPNDADVSSINKYLLKSKLQVHLYKKEEKSLETANFVPKDGRVGEFENCEKIEGKYGDMLNSTAAKRVEVRGFLGKGTLIFGALLAGVIATLLYSVSNNSTISL